MEHLTDLSSKLEEAAATDANNKDAYIAKNIQIQSSLDNLERIVKIKENEDGCVIGISEIPINVDLFECKNYLKNIDSLNLEDILNLDESSFIVKKMYKIMDNNKVQFAISPIDIIKEIRSIKNVDDLKMEYVIKYLLALYSSSVFLEKHNVLIATFSNLLKTNIKKYRELEQEELIAEEINTFGDMIFDSIKFHNDRIPIKCSKLRELIK